MTPKQHRILCPLSVIFLQQSHSLGIDLIQLKQLFSTSCILSASLDDAIGNSLRKFRSIRKTICDNAEKVSDLARNLMEWSVKEILA